MEQFLNSLGEMFMEAKLLQPYFPVYSIDIGYGLHIKNSPVAITLENIVAVGRKSLEGSDDDLASGFERRMEGELLDNLGENNTRCK